MVTKGVLTHRQRVVKVLLKIFNSFYKTFSKITLITCALLTIFYFPLDSELNDAERDINLNLKIVLEDDSENRG